MAAKFVSFLERPLSKNLLKAQITNYGPYLFLINFFRSSQKSAD